MGEVRKIGCWQPGKPLTEAAAIGSRDPTSKKEKELAGAGVPFTTWKEHFSASRIPGPASHKANLFPSVTARDIRPALDYSHYASSAGFDLCRDTIHQTITTIILALQFSAVC